MAPGATGGVYGGQNLMARAHAGRASRAPPGYERGARRAPREPGDEFSPRAGYRSGGATMPAASAELCSEMVRECPDLLLHLTENCRTFGFVLSV
jgi:hypothetical protein